MKIVIDIPDEYYEEIKSNTEGYIAEGYAMDAIRQGVAYEERPHGKWILIDDVDDPLDRLNRHKCSECGRIIQIYDWQTFSDYPFCHCGADMRVKHELSTS